MLISMHIFTYVINNTSKDTDKQGNSLVTWVGLFTPCSLNRGLQNIHDLQNKKKREREGTWERTYGATASFETDSEGRKQDGNYYFTE